MSWKAILYSVMVKYQIVYVCYCLTFDIFFVLKHNNVKSNIHHKIKQLLKPFYFLTTVDFLFLVITASKAYINATFFCHLGKEDIKLTKCLHICDGSYC